MLLLFLLTKLRASSGGDQVEMFGEGEGYDDSVQVEGYDGYNEEEKSNDYQNIAIPTIYLRFLYFYI